MPRPLLLAIFVAVTALAPARAADEKEWCTDAHMQKMDTMIAKMTDAKSKTSAQAHLDQSKAAMKEGDTDGCIAHMKEAHKAMGL